MRAHVLHAALADRRRRLLSAARGRVLEIGGGRGLNLEHYRGVESVAIVEPAIASRAWLRERVAQAPVPVTVHDVGVEQVDSVEGGGFDTVVSTLGLCLVGDLPACLASITRAMAADGQLLFLEHCRAAGPRGLLQRAAGPVWPRLFAGCHPDRDTVAAMRDAGLVVTDLERFTLPLAGPVVGTVAQGSARLPIASDR